MLYLLDNRHHEMKVIVLVCDAW